MNYILGLDCSTKGTGGCIIDKDNFNLIDRGGFKVNPIKERDILRRIKFMMNVILDIVNKFNHCQIVEENLRPSIKNI